MAGKDSDDDKDKSTGSEENFGLPDIEYKPLDEAPANKSEQGSEQSSETTPPADTYDSYAVDDSKSKAPVVITVVIILVVAIAGYLIYNFVYKPKAEKAKQELAAKQEAERRLASERAAEEQRKKEEQRKREEEALANAKPAVGSIEILSSRTRRYYVVVSSDIDDDLLMDYAKKLSASGVSTKIIPPFGGKNFHRLTVADHETFALAQTNADAAKATYGAGVWVIKY